MFLKGPNVIKKNGKKSLSVLDALNILMQGKLIILLL